MTGWDAGGAGPPKPDIRKPSMQFSMGAASKGPARLAQAGMAAAKGIGAFSMSGGPRKAPVKQVVAAFGMDSDEDD